MEVGDFTAATLVESWLAHLLESPRGRRAFVTWALAVRGGDWLQYAARWSADPHDERLAQECFLSFQRLMIEIGRLVLDRDDAQIAAQIALDESALLGDEAPEEEPPPPAPGQPPS